MTIMPSEVRDTVEGYYTMPAWVPFPGYAQGACRKLAPEEQDIFFPEGNVGSTADAKVMCLSCPVRQQCLDYALEMEGDLGKDNRFGIWGGATAVQRVKISKGEDVELYRECAYSGCGREFPMGSNPKARCCSQKCSELHRFERRKAA